MSNRRTRPWYRLSSIVRPTPYSSRDPSPPRYEPPTYPTASSSFPPSPRSPLNDVQETKPSPALSSPELRHERVTTRQEIITYSAEMFPADRSLPPPFPRSPSKDVQETKPRHEHVTFSDKTHIGPNKENEQQIIDKLAQTARPSYLPPSQPSPDLSSPKPWHERVSTRKEILTFPYKTHLEHGPNKEQEQELVDKLSQAARPSHLPPPQPMSPPLHPPIHEAKKSSVTSPQSTKQEPPNPKQEHETTHHKNIPEETNLVHGPNETISPEFDGDVLMETVTQDVVTISSENKGAVMEILRSLNKTRGHVSFEKSIDTKPKNHIKNGGNCYVNSNVQMVNGSVVYNSSEIHHDPGVNLSLYRIPSFGDGYIIKDHGNGYNSSIN